MYTFKLIKNDKGFRVQFVHKNGNVIFWTESYKTKPSANNALKALKENAATAEVTEADETKAALAKAKAMAKAAAKKAPVKKAPAKKTVKTVTKAE